MCENVFEKSSSPLLDLYIAQRATDEKKTIIPIETAEEQCNPVVSVSTNEVSVFFPSGHREISGSTS